MSVPLRVAACATAMALTLTPEVAGSPAAAGVVDPTAVQMHRREDQLSQLRRKQDLLRRRQEQAQRRHERHLALVRLRQAVHRKQVRMMARYRARAERAVRFAYRQRGKPYRWGGTGPRGYDCSGLAQRAWRAAGVRIPRMTYGQYRIRPRIARHRLRPGDLVFFHGLGHVGIYVGRARFIHSPHRGSHVRVDRLRGYYRKAFVGAVRPAWPRLPKLPSLPPTPHQRHR
ncbi:MAG TPA: C40 family peptidase [Streptosporangiaceae bacterium]|nr:C40 family peptidase [Streptosporangiaceae bacterium]